MSVVQVAAILGATALLGAQQIEIGSAPGRLVDIGRGGCICTAPGSGAPTVVIEAGASAFAIDFALV